MAVSGVEKLLAAAGPQIKEVEVEFEGVKSALRIRQLSFNEAAALPSLLGDDGKVDQTKMGEFRRGFVAQAIYGDDDKPAYTAEQIGSWPATLVNKIEQIVRDANGLNETAVADATKNS